MGDIYGISNSIAEANALHGKIALESEQRQSDYQAALTNFQNGIKAQKTNDTSENDKSIASDGATVSKVYNVGNAAAQGIKGAGGAIASDIAGRAARTGAAAGGAARIGPVASQAAFLAESGAAARGGVAQTDLAGEAAGSLASRVGSAASSVASGARAGASGFVEGARASGGVATSLAEQMAPGGLSGVEGIAQKVIGTLKGGDTLAFAGGKIAGAAGGLIAGGEQLDSLIKTGGKSGLTRTDASGNQVELSGIDKAGEFLSEASSVADVAAAASGGLFVPFAAALNLAGAAVSTIGSIEDDKADNKKVGINSDGTTDATLAPKLAAAPISEAYTSLGFLGNQTHNPLAFI